MNSNIKIVLGVIIALFVGLVAGYYYGNARGLVKGNENGMQKGRLDLLAEQKKAQEEELSKIIEEANVFNEVEKAVNPFKDAYKNPFAQ